MTARSVLLPAFLLVAACKGSSLQAGAKPDRGPTAPAGYDATVRCPDLDELYTIGKPNDFGVDVVEFDWEWSDELGGSYTQMVYARIPPGTVSLSISVDAGLRDAGLSVLSAGGEVWIDEDFGSPPLHHFPSPGGSIVLPVNDVTYPAAGCLAFLPVADADLAGEPGRAVITSRRYEARDEVLDLNLILVDGVELYEDEIDAALAVMGDLYWYGYGPDLGTVTLYTYANPAGDVICADCKDLERLHMVTTDAPPQAMNLFFVSGFLEPGILGIAGGIPGAFPQGLASTGVVVAVDPHLSNGGTVLDTRTMGETMAHEVGHQLGLFHTTEADGEHDPIADTPACPMSQDSDGDGTLTASECQSFDGDNFMFWTSANGPQDRVSSTQSDILYYSPVVR